MRRPTICTAVSAGILCVLSYSGLAQLDVRGRLRHKRLLRYEPVIVDLRIVNRSSELIQLSLSNASSRLVFDVEQVPGGQIPERSDGEMRTINVPPRASIEESIDLLKIYDLRTTGPYTIRAHIDWEGTSFISPPMYLDILTGFELTHLVADAPRGGSRRVYTLRTLYRDSADQLFLTVEEKGSVCLGVLDLGSVVRLNEPQLQVDGEGDIHVLFQHSPSLFFHCIIDGGALLISRRESFRVAYGHLEILEDDSGRVFIVGADSREAVTPSNVWTPEVQEDLGPGVDDRGTH